MSTKELWLPKSEMTVTIQDGKLVVTETMQMTARPIAAPTGFKVPK